MIIYASAPHPSATAICLNAITALQTSLNTLQTDKALSTLLIGRIESWLLGSSAPVTATPPNNHPFAAAISQALTKQNMIGWDQVLWGHLTQTWGDCYISCHHHGNAPRPPPNRQKWTKTIIHWAFNLLLALWDNYHSLGF